MWDTCGYGRDNQNPHQPSTQQHTQLIFISTLFSNPAVLWACSLHVLSSAHFHTSTMYHSANANSALSLLTQKKTLWKTVISPHSAPILVAYGSPPAYYSGVSLLLRFTLSQDSAIFLPTKCQLSALKLSQRCMLRKSLRLRFCR